MNRRSDKKKSRRGAIVVLAAALMVVVLGYAAFSIDTGYIVLARTQLQAAADASALAAAATMGSSPDVSTQAAIRYAGLNRVGSRSVQMNNSDVVYGSWNATSQTFTPIQSGYGNAVKVTARADGTHGGSVPLFFAKVLGRDSVDLSASAVAVANPRDICFVVDLSSSMNDDTDPADTATIDSSYPGIGTQMVQNMFTDFGWGAYPGASEAIGKPLGVTTLAGLTSTTTSPLLNTRQPRTLTVGGTNYSYTVPAQYQFRSTDTSAVRTQKAYSWVMDVQLRGVAGFPPLPGIMLAAKPTPNSADSNNYNYWKGYLSANSSNIGYKSYLAAIEPTGSDVKPFSGSTLYSPMSINSPDCPYHSESTDGGTFSFPPREMPTHAARRSIIAALKVVKDRNEIVTDVNQRDWVSIVTFSLTTKVAVAHSLSGNYDTAMHACTTLQATGTSSSCTASETGLMTAMNHLNSAGRPTATKVVIFLTDGKPNLYSSTTTAIANYRAAHPNSNFYGGSSYYAQDAALMQASVMRGSNWMFFPIVIGLQGDAGFMDRIYSVGMGKTTQTLTSPYAATASPALYESQLRTVFEDIISKCKFKLVQ